MKAVIVTCFESNEERLSFVYETLINKGYDVTAFTTDFSHVKKDYRNNVPKIFNVVHTKSYKKNLSIGRLLSHFYFSNDVFDLIDKDVPELIWLMAPANSLIKCAKKFKKNHPQTKLIIDIIDMWPESLPININKDIFPLNTWKNLRTNNIGCADYLVTECDFYHEKLDKEYKGNTSTIHWARDSKAYTNKIIETTDKLVLCYIGSINNIIDTELIANIIKNINMPVEMHVIGEGENTDKFLKSLKKVCSVIYHGPIRDEDKKSEIFDLCHAGINIYKKDLYIGLTVKCIDYFKHGLPIINNIKGDTFSFVEKYNVGINISDNQIIDANSIIKMRNNNNNIFDLYNKYFTKESFIEKCSKVVDEVMG